MTTNNIIEEVSISELEKQRRFNIIRQYYKHRIHYGHHPNQLNPKMIPYLYKGKLIKKPYDTKGYHMINISLTSHLLNKARLLLEELSEETVYLFVGTKFQLKSVVAKEAERCNQYYVNYRWLGGMLTNWKTVKLQLNKLKDLEEQAASGVFSALPIKEANKRTKRLNHLKKCLSGIKDMPRLPDLVIVTHLQQDFLAIQECRKLGIPIIGIVDTNCDPDLVDYVIPANDDSTLSVQYILHNLVDSILGESTVLNKKN